jgi:4-amino-4-deoxy-L-arabinose transferase-like glycosyltransferase
MNILFDEDGEVYYGRIVWIIFLAGTILRLLLYGASYPANAVDDHFNPIMLIIQSGHIPPLDACWECHQPPLFYYISSVVGRLSLFLGAGNATLRSVLEFLPCLYGILTLPVVYRILKMLPLTDFSRVLAFGLAAFLPRHIYMSALHTNDTFAALMVSVTIYLLLVALDKGLSPYRLACLAIAISLGVITKHTALVVLPMVTVVFLADFIWKISASRKVTALKFALVVALPLAILASKSVSNQRDYGAIFPLNSEMLDITIDHLPGADNISFTDFKPHLAIKSPFISPENVNSFWTNVYGRLWFDMAPRFHHLDNRNMSWWDNYYDYFVKFEPGWPSLVGIPDHRRLIGSAILAAALVPTFLMALGCLYAVFGRTGFMARKEERFGALKVVGLPVLLAFNVIGLSVKLTSAHCILFRPCGNAIIFFEIDEKYPCALPRGPIHSDINSYYTSGQEFYLLVGCGFGNHLCALQITHLLVKKFSDEGLRPDIM